ncbi:hypothetical protein BCR44DRAFT_1424220 [Catenaria anguillulae PL171]|uniref:Replication factor C subunit 1 n=1 Tax=Catenaria anguillulae PL171 TaxID=765915 RepID=A0A1Y2I4R3_9FUNG|nr:hypothetical protein BCR44DRAFT_1424220 [Catenaria anguillulae PL171]
MPPPSSGSAAKPQAQSAAANDDDAAIQAMLKPAPPKPATSATSVSRKKKKKADSDDDFVDDEPTTKRAKTSATAASTRKSATVTTPKAPVKEISASDYFANVPRKRSTPASTSSTPVPSTSTRPSSLSTSEPSKSQQRPAEVVDLMDVDSDSDTTKTKPQKEVVDLRSDEAEVAGPASTTATSTSSSTSAKKRPLASTSSSAPKPTSVHQESDSDDDVDITRLSKKKKKAATASAAAAPANLGQKAKPLIETVPEAAYASSVASPYASSADASLYAAAAVAGSSTSASGATQNPDDPDTPAQKKVPVWIARKAQAAAGPRAAGSKVVPQGQENCLHGLTFVLSGDFDAFSRDEMDSIIKRYGGRTTGAVSGKTDYLVRGENPGESKTKKAAALGTKIVDEDFVLELIRTRKGKSEAQVEASKPKTQVKREMAVSTINETQASTASALWTDKYRPTKSTEIIGNKGQIEKLKKWLEGFANARKSKFKFMGEDRFDHVKAVLISGAPGIGKTTAAHVVAKECGFNVLEFNASDMRNKKSLDQVAAHLTDNQTLFDAFKTGKSSSKHCIIMDEVDGMSGSDRGGLQELVALIKKTQVPIICICNDRSQPKMKTLTGKCLELRFARPDANAIRSRLMTICYREGLKIPAPALDVLSASTRSDIRQIIHLLSTYRLKDTAMDYDAATHLSSTSEKDKTTGMFDATRNLLSSSHVRRATVNDLMDEYFVDFDMVPLMMHENYLSVNAASNPLEALDRLTAAADSIAQSDRINTMVRNHQHWSLLPAHGVFSTAAPAHAMCSGNSSSGMRGMIAFTSLLGNMSKANKGNRILGGLDKRISRASHGASPGRVGVRLDYVPNMTKIVHHWWAHGEVPAMIGTMDHYFIGREDLDELFDLRVGKLNGEVMLKMIPPKDKAAFTRQYNAMEHPLFQPIPVGAAKKGRGDGAGAGADDDEMGDPDVEGYERDDVGEAGDASDAEGDRDEDDPEAIRKALEAAKGKAKGKGKAKAGAAASSSSGGPSSSSSARGGRGRGRGRGK